MSIKSILENCLLPSGEQEEFFNVHGRENRVTKQRYSSVSVYYKKTKPVNPKHQKTLKRFSETLQLQDKQDRQAKRQRQAERFGQLVTNMPYFISWARHHVSVRNNKTPGMYSRHIRACIVILGLGYTMKYQKNKKDTSHVYSWMNITLTYLAPN